MQGYTKELVEAVVGRLFVPVEASGRHVHVTREQALRLFGQPLEPLRPLSQPGQFVARQRVTVVGPKGQFENVAVLGPERKSAQVEVSLTDARALGLKVPVRLSGDTEGSPGCLLKGPKGEVQLAGGVIAAQRHIHMSPRDAKHFHVCNGQLVSLKVYSRRPVIFEEVPVRVDEKFETAAHLDYDEANGCGFADGDLGRILP